MSWLAISPLATLLLWVAAAGLALWLYLHQRPTRRRVSTLRFWADLPPSVYRRRRWLREPWAYAAQALFLLLILLALANPRWGQVTQNRRVAMVLDASIWSQVQPAGEPQWIERVRADAVRTLNSLPDGDEVLLLRSEADAAPILPFSHDRAAQFRAIASVRVSSSNADVPRALESARAAISGANGGLLIYVGPGILDEQQSRRFEEFRSDIESPIGAGVATQFAVHLVGGSTAIENRGITGLALQRDAMQPDRWHLLTQIRNYSDSKQDLTLNLSVGGQPLLKRAVSLAPGELSALKDEFTTSQGGLLQAEISPSDDLRADDRAIVYVPAFQPVRVAVFSTRTAFADELRPVLSANPYLRAEFVRPGAAVNPPPDVEIHDGGNPSTPSAVNSIYFLKGPNNARTHSVRVMDWNPQHPATRWVRTRDVTVRNPAVLDVKPTDKVLASGEGEPEMPLIVAREQNKHRSLIIGFDPNDSNFPQQSAFPLLMAGSIEWLAHPVEDVSNSLSAGDLDLPGPATRIVSPGGSDIAFARNGTNVHLLAMQTGLYRLIAANRTATYAVNAPALPPSLRMNPTPEEMSPITSEVIPYQGQYLWTWLTLLAIVALWAEWWFFYMAPANRFPREAISNEIPAAPPVSESDSQHSKALDAKAAR